MALQGVCILLIGSSTKQREIRGKAVRALKGVVLPAPIHTSSHKSASGHLASEVTHIVVDLDNSHLVAPNTFDATWLQTTVLPYPSLFSGTSGSVGIVGGDAGVFVLTAAWLNACLSQKAKVSERAYLLRAVEQAAAPSPSPAPSSSSSASVSSSASRVETEDVDGAIHSAKRCRVDYAAPVAAGGAGSSVPTLLAGGQRPQLFPALGPDLCDMTNQKPAVREEGARATAAAGHWSATLGQYNQPDSATLYPSLVLHHDPVDGLFIVRDLYPKAKVHVLILASPEKLSARTVNTLTQRDVPILQSMRKLADRLLTHFHRLSGGTLSFLPVGFHSTPSLRTLHLHVISCDLESPFLKNKTHWNSFTLVPDFFVPLDMVLHALHSDDKQQPKPLSDRKREPEPEHKQSQEEREEERDEEQEQMPPMLVPWRMQQAVNNSSSGAESAERGGEESLHALLARCVSKEAMDHAPTECPLCGELPGGPVALRGVREHWASCKRRTSAGTGTGGGDAGRSAAAAVAATATLQQGDRS